MSASDGGGHCLQGTPLAVAIEDHFLGDVHDCCRKYGCIWYPSMTRKNTPRARMRKLMQPASTILLGLVNHFRDSASLHTIMITAMSKGNGISSKEPTHPLLKIPEPYSLCKRSILYHPLGGAEPPDDTDGEVREFLHVQTKIRPQEP